MKSIKLVLVFILLINLLLIESFESKNDLVSNNIDNLQQPAILNDGEDTNSIEKRQSGPSRRKQKKTKKQKRRNKKNRIQQIREALTQLQTQIASIGSRLDSLLTTTTMAPGAGRRI
uniref:BZIP domain-containing protein n=1 Tax=Strongyloides papillosus TaxID=174720 RepID=A0A0N5BJM8_STREA